MDEEQARYENEQAGLAAEEAAAQDASAQAEAEAQEQSAPTEQEYADLTPKEQRFRDQQEADELAAKEAAEKRAALLAKADPELGICTSCGDEPATGLILNNQQINVAVCENCKRKILEYKAPTEREGNGLSWPEAPESDNSYAHRKEE